MNPQPGVREKSAYGVLYQLKNGCNWSDLPSCFTSLLNSILALQAVADITNHKKIRDALHEQVHQQVKKT